MAQQEFSKAELELAKLKALIAIGVPGPDAVDMAPRVNGETPEAIAEDVEAFTSLLERMDTKSEQEQEPEPTPLPTAGYDPSQGHGGSGLHKQSPAQAFADMIEGNMRSR